MNTAIQYNVCNYIDCKLKKTQNCKSLNECDYCRELYCELNQKYIRKYCFGCIDKVHRINLKKYFKCHIARRIELHFYQKI